jgi:hypothetical protein
MTWHCETYTTSPEVANVVKYTAFMAFHKKVFVEPLVLRRRQCRQAALIQMSVPLLRGVAFLHGAGRLGGPPAFTPRSGVAGTLCPARTSAVCSGRPEFLSLSRRSNIRTLVAFTLSTASLENSSRPSGVYVFALSRSLALSISLIYFLNRQVSKPFGVRFISHSLVCC